MRSWRRRSTASGRRPWRLGSGDRRVVAHGADRDARRVLQERQLPDPRDDRLLHEDPSAGGGAGGAGPVDVLDGDGQLDDRGRSRDEVAAGPPGAEPAPPRTRGPAGGGGTP